MSLLSEGITVPFCSYWAYHPINSRQPHNGESSASRDLCNAIKQNRSYRQVNAIQASAEQIKKTPMEVDVFKEPCIAVPVPGSSPRVPNALWTPLEIAKALRDQGLVEDVAECLVRERPVAKSSFADRGSRPGPLSHFESIRFDSLVDFGGCRVVLVDDVITKGATIAGCAARIWSHLPGIPVFGFAMVRTMGIGNFERVRHPTSGIIIATEQKSDRHH